MFKALYTKHQYFFNLLIALIFLTTIRTVDWIVWTPASLGLTKKIVINHLFELISGIPLIILLIYSYLWAIKKNSIILIIVLVFFYSLFGAIILKYVAFLLKYILWEEGAIPLTWDLIIKFTAGGFIFVLSLSATFYLTYIWLQFLNQKDATFKAETLAKDAQLKMLRYQINPHFLFNTLNSLYALTDENKNKAKELIVSISEYYRYTLDKQLQTSTIESEVQAIRKFLEIQKIRFEEKFEYEISVDQDLYSFQIPSFILLLLIENAVKYGIKSNEQKLVIRLLATIFNNEVHINVLNTGKFCDPNNSNISVDGTGNGLDNIKNRLSLFYNDNFSFSINEANGWVDASIKIVTPTLCQS